MMEVGSGYVRVSVGSKEDSEFSTLCQAITGLEDEFLVEYHNLLISLREYRTPTQDMMLDAIAYVRGQIRLDRV